MVLLIVDDDADDLDFFKEAVEEINKDIECKCALNGLEAIKMLDAGEIRPDLIFLDLNMPKMDGRKCLHLLKKSPVFQNIPVIIYSTSSRKDDIDEVTALGATAYIVKPTTFKQLKEEITTILYT